MTTFNFIETVILAFSCQQWLFDQNEGSSETFQIKYCTSILWTYNMYIEYNIEYTVQKENKYLYHFSAVLPSPSHLENWIQFWN